MDASQPAPNKPQRKLMRWLIPLACVIIVMCGFVILFIRSSGTGTSTDLAVMRQMGVPTNEHDFNKLIPRRGVDGGPLMRQYFASLDKLPASVKGDLENAHSSEGYEYPITVGKPVFDLAKQTACLKRIEPQVDMIREAAKTDYYDFGPFRQKVDTPYRPDKQVALFYSTLTPNDHLGSISTAADASELLLFAAHCECLSGDPEKALADIALAQRNIWHLDKLPDQGQRTRNGDQEIIMGWLRVLWHYRKNKQIVDLAVKTLEDFPPLPNVKNEIKQHFLFDLETLQATANLNGLPRVGTRSGLIASSEVNRRREIGIANAQFIHLYRLILEAIPDNADDATIESILDKYTHLASTTQPMFDYYGSLVTGRMQLLLQFHEQRLGARRVALLTGKLLQKRLSGQALPDTLSEFGEDAIVPRTGKPITYTKKGTGFDLRAKHYYNDQDFLIPDFS